MAKTHAQAQQPPQWKPEDAPPPSSDATCELQVLLDALFARKGLATSLDLIALAEVHDADEAVLEVVNLLPSGSYSRQQMADQLNSIVTAHGWSDELGTVS